MQGGLRSGIRIAQGSYFRITLLKATPVQVDGEPWVQAPGHIIISAAGFKVCQAQVGGVGGVQPLGLTQAVGAAARYQLGHLCHVPSTRLTTGAHAEESQEAQEGHCLQGQPC